MKNLFLRTALLGLSLIFTREVRGEFNPALVAGDSRWVVYADLNTLRESPIGKQLVAATSKFQLDANSAPVHLNLPRLLATVGNITAYGANFSKDAKQVDGTLVIQGTPELRKIAEALLIEGNLANPQAVTEVKDMGYPAYALSEPDNKNQDAPHVIVAFPSEPIVLVSKSADHLRRARELFLGRGQSLAQNPSSPLNGLMGEVGHSTLFAATLVPSEQLFPANAPQARILHMATSVSIALGDEGGKTFAHAQLRASSDDMADKLQKILQGMTAMLSLAESSDQQLNEFLNSAVVARQYDTVTLKLAYSSDRLAAMLQHMMETAPARRPGSGPSIGTVAGSWTIPVAAAGDDQPAASPVLKSGTAKLTNGSAITIAVESTDPRAWSHLVRVRIIPAGDAAGSDAPAPLVFSRKFMTELHRPIARKANGATTREFQFYFPGESGSYTFDVNFTPAEKGDVKLSVGVMDPAGETPRERPSDSNEHL